eukprot:TRINITY_DN107746_c0_g1_i1.p1 TRINITY_DN107746_c0_g1~~TRINITY_DN107746_c0_g1_i1.p1  ORF type:complete len:411 (-),score=58.45 TRINITY_DN107746_c0_g1_i1:82-1314(-)
MEQGFLVDAMGCLGLRDNEGKASFQSQLRSRHGRSLGRRLVSGLLASTGLIAGWPAGFVPAPGRRGHDRGTDKVPGSSASIARSTAQPKALGETKASAATQDALVLSASVALGLGAALAEAGRPRGPRSLSTATQRAAEGSDRLAPRVDWGGASTGWADIPSKSILQVDWLNIHGLLTVSSMLLFLGQISRILAHKAPSELEVWITTAIYLPWIYYCWRDTDQLENHYAVTFYASCGWAFMSLASLHSVVYQDKFPDVAFGILALGNLVFLTSCIYFYGYHWTRMWRHFQQNRFRPLWIPGLLGLMCLHLLTPLDFLKRMDDMGWWKTVCSVYSDEWWWVADVRIIELFVTAAALLLIILHIQGVFTGMKNAAVVVIFTIFAPLGLMVLESTWLRASAWQHYLMVGPKYF